MGDTYAILSEFVSADVSYTTAESNFLASLDLAGEEMAASATETTSLLRMLPGVEAATVATEAAPTVEAAAAGDLLTGSDFFGEFIEAIHLDGFGALELNAEMEAASAVAATTENCDNPARM